ncbi:PEP-CTERM putative exosortase interaction domain-containing protein [Opitutaceae bacterium TAV1]|nr:PEP-CTERM putative exosortase interaction domain-containing protein [Opitutaceae bacterium TAV1]
MAMNSHIRKLLLSVARPVTFGAALLAGSLHAAVYIEETFTGYTAGALAGQSVQGTGLSGTWSKSGTGSGSTTAELLTSNLGFGSLSNSGGSLRIKSSGQASQVLAAAVDVSGTGSTIYSAFVFKIETASVLPPSGSPNPTASFAGMRLGNGGNLSVLPDGSVAAGAVPSSAWLNSTLSSWGALDVGETYIVISEYTGIGSTSNAGGILTSYYLTEAQFEVFKTNGFAGIASAKQTDGTVSAKTYAKATSGNFSITGSALQFALNDKGEADGLSMVIDAVRFGDSFDAVTPQAIPEPGTWAGMAGLAVLGIAAALRRRRRA